MHLLRALRRSLLLGRIQGRTFVPRLPLAGVRGLPVAVAFHVGLGSRAPAGVGAEVKRRLFPDTGDFVVNVAFASGGYGDPASHWSTAFAGCYQVDVPRASWDRPFGYVHAGPGAAPRLEELVRLAKADWNWFTARPYGVPVEAIAPLDAFDPGDREGRHLGRVRAGGTLWDDVEFDGVRVACPAFPPGGHGLELTHPVWTRAWRLAIGAPRAGPAGSASFPPVRVRGRMLMSHRTVDDPRLGGPGWSTLVFGGSVRVGHPDPATAERLLATQLDACRRLVERSYPAAGFPETR